MTLSQASHALANVSLPKKIDGVPAVHLPWRDVLAAIAEARQHRRGRERLWLEEFGAYLKGAIRMRRVGDSWTFCVVLNDERPWGLRSFKEYVTDHLNYFHPYGIGRWPTEFPNFLAFRWSGAVHRIHRVHHVEVVPSLRDRWPDLPKNKPPIDRPHAVYELGPRLPPFNPIPNGRQFRSGHLWVLLDQLQTAPTLAEAVDRSNELKRSEHL